MDKIYHLYYSRHDNTNSYRAWGHNAACHGLCPYIYKEAMSIYVILSIVVLMGWITPITIWAFSELKTENDVFI
jgi:hypothetical protein